jgi:hypothetical protein
MVLSLSPGPAPLDKSAEVAANAQLWRISDDVWDRWERPASEHFPQGVKNQFEVIASWVPHVKPGNWPDADMLPLGTLGPVPGWGSPRKTRLTEDEQKTLMTLWAIARSPLFVGANLTELDDWTAALLTNKDIVALDQMTLSSQQVSRDGDLITWTADLKDGSHALAFFNIGDAPTAVKEEKPWVTTILAYKVRDVWGQKDVDTVQAGYLGVQIPPHGVLLLKLKSR